MIDVYDNVLEEHNAILVDDEVKKISWKYDYPSEPSKPNRHWHVLCGHNKEECDAASYDWADTIFNMFMDKLDFKSKYNVENYIRIYCNAHTHGIEPHIHRDDGDFTMIYYPRLDWQTAWGGGTAIYSEDTVCTAREFKTAIKIISKIDKHVEYKGNRLIVFDAYLPHQAQPVSRQCYELRTCVVFKCNVSGGNRERLDFYKENSAKGKYLAEVVNDY